MIDNPKQHNLPRPRLLDASGAVINMAAYDAARTTGQMGDWLPAPFSADAALLPERATISSRVYDIARNDGWHSSALTKHVDNVIGHQFVLNSNPDWRALGQDEDWAREWSEQVERAWRGYAEHPDFYCDVERHSPMVGLFGLLYRHRILSEALAVLHWMPNRGGDYATAVQVIDPDRLSNKNDEVDSELLRGGRVLDQHNAVTAYQIRIRHPGDFFASFRTTEFDWEVIPAYTPSGRRRVIHDFEKKRAGMNRGESLMAPMLEMGKTLGAYNKAELGAALMNAIFAAFIESPFDHSMLSGSLKMDRVDDYIKGQTEFRDDHARVSLSDGARVGFLYPGEKMNFTQATRPNEAYAPFIEQSLRNMAAACGLSYEQFAGDYSRTNYSSARAAMAEVWKFMTARSGAFASGTAGQVYCAWLEEAMDIGVVETPPGAPSFRQAKAAYSRSTWTGPAKGIIDPQKEAQGAVLRMQHGLSNLKIECANLGQDWREIKSQRTREKKVYEEDDDTLPQWQSGPPQGMRIGQPGQPDQPGSEDPDKEDEDENNRNGR